MRLNTKMSYKITNHEGGPAKRITPYSELRRSVLATLLWEDQFYESGEDCAARIQKLAAQVTPQELAALAVEARTTHNLRHVPLLLLCQLVKAQGQRSLVSLTIENVLQRADELTEFVAMYWKLNGKKVPLTNPMKIGLAKAFTRFDEYQLAKYNRANAVKLRDVLFLCHAKPKDALQDALWKRLIADELTTPDTWEVELSAGKDKKATFERLITERKLGYLALLRNLRNMEQAGCDRDIVRDAIISRRGGAERVLPFRFIAAARAAPMYASALDNSMVAGLANLPKLPGTTAILVDVSGSMDTKLSGKSDLMRIDAAAALAAVANCEDLRVFTFSDGIVEVPAYRGMAGVEAVIRSQSHSGTHLGAAVQFLHQRVKHDRLIVITDEQSADRVPDPIAKDAYMINVASYQNGVGYGKFNHIDGFSENILRWIHEFERLSGE